MEENNYESNNDMQPNQTQLEQQTVSQNDQQFNAQNMQQAVFKPEPKMGWYKFLINFGLFAGAALNFISAILQITGYIYVREAIGKGYYSGEMFSQTSKTLIQAVYSAYDGLQKADIFCGLLLIVLAGFGIYVRFQLAKFKANSTSLLIILYVAASLISILYMLIAGNIIGSSVFDFSALVPSIFMIIFNYQYFKPRKYLFIN